MATWKKSPPELIAAFDIALAGEMRGEMAGEMADEKRVKRVERRQMFGYPCAFVNGHLAVGLHESRLIARVPEAAEQRPCVILGRRMKAYAAIDLDEALAPGSMRHWVGRAVAFTATMAPKAAKAPRAPRAPQPAAMKRPAPAATSPRAPRTPRKSR